MPPNLLSAGLNMPSLLSSLSASSSAAAGFNGAASGDAAQATSFSQALREARSPSPAQAPAMPPRTASAEPTPTPTPAQREPEQSAVAERHGPATAHEHAAEEDVTQRRAAGGARRPAESATRRTAASARSATREGMPAQPTEVRAKTAGSSCTGPANASETASAVDPKHQASATRDDNTTAIDASLLAAAEGVRQVSSRDELPALPLATGRAGHDTAHAGADAGADADLAGAAGPRAGAHSVPAISALGASTASAGKDVVDADNTALLRAFAGEPARERIGELTSSGPSTPMLVTLAGASALGGAQAAGVTAGSSMSEAVLHAAPGSDAFTQELAGQVSYFVREGVQQARLQLNPQELGPVLVSIQLDGQTAQVHMAAELQLTRQALEQALPALASQLSEAGITLTGGGVFEQRSGQFGAGDGPSERQHDGSPADATSSRGSATAVEPVPARWQRARGIVDLVA